MERRALTQLRKERGVSRKDLAVAVGVSIPAVQYWEYGTSAPTDDNRKRVAEFFGVDPDEIAFAPHKKLGRPLEQMS